MGNQAVHNNDSSDGHELNSISTYSKLINMGFPEDLSMKASQIHPNDINKAISWVAEHTVDQNKNIPQNEANEEKKLPDLDIIDEVELESEIDTDCTVNITCCLSLKQIIKCLINYQNDDDDVDETLSKELINNFHHILSCHVNEDTLNQQQCDENFKLIYSMISKEIICDISSCKIYVRSNRAREQKSNENTHLTLYNDLLDSIHCYLIHSVDIGYRIIDNIHSKINPNKHENTSYDTKMIALKSYLSVRRQNLINIRGQNRFSNNKFVTKFASNDEKSSVSGINQGNNHGNNHGNNDVQYSFGTWYDYWHESNKHKYDSFKLEMINNKIFSIDIDKFTDLYEHCQALLRGSGELRKLRVAASNYEFYKSGKVSQPNMTIPHILSVKLYTDFDTLSYNFTKTFRKIHPNESDQAEKHRHREYWWWSKLLCATINCFGKKVRDTEISIFYHGVSHVYFDKFVATFNSPTSTTSKLQIAAIFAKNDGIILSLKPYWTSPNLTYFNCSFISCFPNEDERLFINPFNASSFLEFHSIRNLSTNENYTDFIVAFKKLHRIVNGEAVEFDIFSSDCQSKIKHLLLYALTTENEENYPEYILKCLLRWTNQKKLITINMKYFEQSYQFLSSIFLYSDKNASNLLGYDKINIMFAHITTIHCDSTGFISSAYLKALMTVLDNIFNSSDSKLKYIFLNDVENIEEIKQYPEYQDLLNLFNGTAWKCFVTADTLRISR